jgi:DNA-binding LacI/PurR family transcriptional regulator
MASVREIARQANVSKTTVSLVLRKQEGVSETLRLRVQEALEQLRVLEEARAAEETTASLVSSKAAPEEQKTCSLLVLHPANILSSTVFNEFIRGIQSAAALYHLQLNLAFNDSNLLTDNFESLYFSNPILRPMGLVVIGAQIEEPVVDRASALGIPVVLVGRTCRKRGVSAVGRDEESAAYEATGYLLDLGHKNLAFLGGSPKYHYPFERLSGFRRAIEERGLAVKEENVLLSYDQEAAANLLLDSPCVTAAVFVNELFASQVLPRVIAGGRPVPDDLSALCFDDTEVSENFDPQLTTVSFPLFQEGFWSVRILMEQVRQKNIVSCQMVFGASLIKRKSCRQLDEG